MFVVALLGILPPLLGFGASTGGDTFQASVSILPNMFRTRSHSFRIYSTYVVPNISSSWDPRALNGVFGKSLFIIPIYSSSPASYS